MHSSTHSDYSPATAARYDVRGESGRYEDRFRVTAKHGSTHSIYNQASAARYVKGESGRQ